MNISAELSLYPLSEDYLAIIKDIVARLNTRDDLYCTTNSMSTQLFGSIDAVMSAIEDCLRYSFERYGKQVLVCKILNSDVRPDV